jgi:peptidyl-prolyl cis-trans isomerase B (cyclophilin B)
MKRLLLSVAVVATCASLAVAAEPPKTTPAKPADEAAAVQPVTAQPAAPAKVEEIVVQPMTARPGAPTKIDDAAVQMIDKFIANAKIDRKAPGWKTMLPKPPQATFDKTRTYLARIATNKGPVLIEFLPRVAPMHVTNFIYLARLGFYDNMSFHRVITGFMAQGGCPVGNGTGGPGYKFAGEFSDTVKHDQGGLLSMANAGPGTDGSQFFLTFVATPWLDGKHTIFGRVVEGMDTLQKLEAAGSRSGAVKEPLKMVKVTIEVK